MVRRRKMRWMERYMNPDMGEQVERRAAAQRDPGLRVEWIVDVVERRFEAEREEDDAGDHGGCR